MGGQLAQEIIIKTAQQSTRPFDKPDHDDMVWGLSSCSCWKRYRFTIIIIMHAHFTWTEHYLWSGNHYVCVCYLTGGEGRSLENQCYSSPLFQTFSFPWLPLTLTLTSSNYYMSPLSLSACFSHWRFAPFHVFFTYPCRECETFFSTGRAGFAGTGRGGGGGTTFGRASHTLFHTHIEGFSIKSFTHLPTPCHYFTHTKKIFF